MLQKEQVAGSCTSELGVCGDLQPALDLEARLLIYDKGALCVAEACERSAGDRRAWKAAASLRVSGITPGHLVCSSEEHKVD